MRKRSKWKLAGRWFIFTWFFISGICHFAFPELLVQIVPPYVPYPLTMVYISGAFQLLGAIAIWSRLWRNLAGYGLMLLTAIVTLGNLQMYQHPELFPGIPEWLLLAPFPVQALLILIIWACTRPPTRRSLPI